MHVLRKQAERHDIAHKMGIVVREEASEFMVRTGGGDCPARRAISCLMMPEQGDLVLLTVTEARVAYILAVLEREEGVTHRLELDGDLEVKLRGGRFILAAQNGVDLASAQAISITTPLLKMNADEGSLVLRKFAFFASLVDAEINRFKLLTSCCDWVADRLLQKLKRSYRFVEEVEHVRAGQIDYVARQNMRMHGKNALVTAEALVKLDGDQIHVG